jgi:hypothetical protein
MNKIYNGWPYNGKYVEILNIVYKIVSQYLYNFVLLNYSKFNNKPKTIIFDIDDTLVYTDPDKTLNFDIQKNIQNLFVFPSIEQISQIARLGYILNFKIIIITARPYSSEKSSILNLKNINVKYHEIYHNDKYPDSSFKIDLKKKLLKDNDIILSIGDQWNDLYGLNNCLCIKLPDPVDNNCYFSFDNNKYYNIISLFN